MTRRTRRWQWALLLLLGACAADAERATRVLKGAGYTEIRLNGYPFFSCSDDDQFNVAFTAKGPTGEPAQGAVCCGWMKNCTIRVE